MKSDNSITKIKGVNFFKTLCKGCAKKMIQLVFVRTSSNIHQIW